MKRKTRLWILLVLGMLAVLLLVMWAAPGWGMPDQNAMRQTVPTRTPTPVVTPWVYLPLVMKNVANSTP